MGFLKYALPVLVATCGVGTAFERLENNDFSSTKEAQQRDFEALREYIKTKRSINVREKGGNLTISGDVRAEYYFMKCKNRGVTERGYETMFNYPNSFFRRAYKRAKKTGKWETDYINKIKHHDDIDKRIPPINVIEPDFEANFILDYLAERGWATMQLRMQDPMGFRAVDRKKGVHIADNRRMLFGSGLTDQLELRKAFFGYNIWEQGTSRFDVEMGHRRLFDVFDSRVQFGNNFDGVLLRLSSSFEGITDVSLKLGVFVIDATVNHIGYVGELGCLNIADTGFDLKYSLIDWERHAPNRYNWHHPLGCRFLNSQVTAAYNISQDVINTKAQIYGAGLINHAADPTGWTYHKLQNKAYYFGVRLGEVIRKGDWATDLCYQYVQVQSVPERDIAGMARDNPRAISFYNRRSGGFGNYKGVRLQGLYALTDNITIDSHFDRVHQACRAIGGKHRSFEFYIAAIFAF